jgi:hypothetical protein
MPRIILCGVRPAALTAVSEMERLRACPHRAQAAVNHARALAQAAGESLPDGRGSDEGVDTGAVPKVAKPKGRKRK